MKKNMRHINAFVSGLLALCCGAASANGADASGRGFRMDRIPCGVRLSVPGRVTTVTSYGPRTLRVNTCAGKSLTTNASLSVISGPVEAAWSIVSDDSAAAVFRLGEVAVRVEKAGANLSFLRPDGSVLLAESAAAVKPVSLAGAPTYEVRQTFTLSPGEAIYGLGQCVCPVLSYRNRKIRIVQANIPAFTPVVTSSEGWGLLWDIYSQSVLEGSPAGLSLWAESAPAGIDYYFFAGPDLDAAVAQYRALTGAAPLFPKQAYGFFMSRERYRSQVELTNVVASFRAAHYPLDFIVQDWQYWPARPEMWNSMTWDPQRFPDPKGLCAALHDVYHVKLMNSIWPSVGNGSDLAKELDANGFRFAPLHWITKQARVYDAYSPEARAIYFRHLKKGLLDAGVDATWMDGTEFETLDACHDQDAMVREIKACGSCALGDLARYLNPYSLLTTRGVYEGQRATSPKRVFTLTRSTWAGQQHYAALPWSGDTSASWACLREQIVGGLSASLSGLPYWTQDTGGFFPGPYSHGLDDPAYRELLVRWNQFAIFNPVYRWHGTGEPREPYRLARIDSAAYAACLSAARLRYRLLPYIYSLAWMTTQSAYTMTRPLVMDFPTDASARNRGDAFLFGPALFVQPVAIPILSREDPAPSAIDSASLSTPDGQPGVRIDYFDGENFDRSAGSAVDAQVDYTWPGPPLVAWPAGLRGGEHFSCRVTGFITAPESGEYEIAISGDDGFRLWLDGKPAIDNWHAAAARYDSARVTLAQGQKVAFRIDYFQNLFDRSLRLCWRKPSARAKVLPADARIRVALPAGASWSDFFTGRRVTGSALERDCPLAEFPLYARAGSIIPMNGEDLDYATQPSAVPLELRVYPGRDAAFTLYEDDGETYAYEKGAYSEIPMAWDDQAATLTLGARRGSLPGAAASRAFRVTVVHPDGQASSSLVQYSGSRTRVTVQ